MKIYLAMIFLIFSCSPAPKRKGILDPRVERFISQNIENQDLAQKMRADLIGVPFERFFSAVFTAELKVDGTPDNSMMLAKLGQYLERDRPEFDFNVIPELEEFERENRTFMRSMLLTTIKELQNPKAK